MLKIYEKGGFKPELCKTIYLIDLAKSSISYVICNVM